MTRTRHESNATITRYDAERLTYRSNVDFEQTRARFDEQVPELSTETNVALVLAGATWPQVVDAVAAHVGPTGFVTLARLDQGALLSLSGDPLEATLYLVGNPVVARALTLHDPGAALYAPFRVAVYRDRSGVFVAYDAPSSVFASLRSPEIDAIATELDDKIRAVAEAVTQ